MDTPCTDVLGVAITESEGQLSSNIFLLMCHLLREIKESKFSTELTKTASFSDNHKIDFIGTHLS